MGSARKPSRRKAAARPQEAAQVVTVDEIMRAMHRGILQAMQAHVSAGIPTAYDKNGVVKDLTIKEMKAILKKELPESP